MTTNATETIRILQDGLSPMLRQLDAMAASDDPLIQAQWRFGWDQMKKFQDLLTDVHGEIIKEVEARAK